MGGGDAGDERDLAAVGIRVGVEEGHLFGVGGILNHPHELTEQAGDFVLASGFQRSPNAPVLDEPDRGNAVLRLTLGFAQVLMECRGDAGGNGGRGNRPTNFNPGLEFVLCAT